MAVWFITGCSSGFGDEIAKAALARGDKVVATARKVTALKHLESLGALTLSLDLSSPESEIEKVVAEAVKKYGTIDILLNNAGAVLEGAIEEISDAEARNLFDINFFGQLKVTRAILPHMRARKSGVIANVGSIAGWEGGVGCGIYSATKFALVAVSEALAAEVAHLGIKATIIEPGYFRTKLLGRGNKFIAEKVIDDLKPAMDPLRKAFQMYNGHQPGDPAKGAKVVVEALTGTGGAEGRTLPRRLALGADAVPYIRAAMATDKKGLDEWEDFVITTNHVDVA